MKKGIFLSVLSLMVAVGSIIIAVAAYQKSHCDCYDDDMDFDDFDFDEDEDEEYFSAEVEEIPDHPDEAPEEIEEAPKN